jgi:hypothetical protein
MVCDAGVTSLANVPLSLLRAVGSRTMDRKVCLSLSSSALLSHAVPFFLLHLTTLHGGVC